MKNKFGKVFSIGMTTIMVALVAACGTEKKEEAKSVAKQAKPKDALVVEFFHGEGMYGTWKFVDQAPEAITAKGGDRQEVGFVIREDKTASITAICYYGDKRVHVVADTSAEVLDAEGNMPARIVWHTSLVKGASNTAKDGEDTCSVKMSRTWGGALPTFYLPEGMSSKNVGEEVTLSAATKKFGRETWTSLTIGWRLKTTEHKVVRWK